MSRIPAESMPRALSLERLKGIAAEEVRAGLEQILEVLRSEIVSRTPVGATGELSRSVVTAITGSGVDVTGVVQSALPYAAVVEEGRAPGDPPPWEPIALWVRGTRAGREITLAVRERYVQRLRRQRTRRSRESFERQAVFLVRRKIARRGTRGARMFAEGLRASEGKLVRLWDMVAQRIASRWQGGEGCR